MRKKKDRNGRKLEPEMNAARCIVHFLNIFTGKIVDFETLERQAGFSYGNYSDPPMGWRFRESFVSSST
jgi:hypothetical protein